MFKARYKLPDSTDKNYISTLRGGYNHALLVNKSTGSVLANCTGYVHGRTLEVAGKDAEAKLSRGDAKGYYSYNDGFERGKEPCVGAIACWGGALTKYGHVAFVEAVNADKSIVISESNYGDAPFRTRTVRRNTDGSYSAVDPTNRFQGFIYIYKEPEPIKAEDGAVYRLYNSKTGEHRWTKSRDRAMSLRADDWTYEGIGWHAPETGQAVYQMTSKAHSILTTDMAEIGTLVTVGWGYSGEVFKSDVLKRTPIYRLYNEKSGDHMFTASKEEKAALLKLGWKDEGVAIWGM